MTRESPQRLIGNGSRQVAYEVADPCVIQPVMDAPEVAQWCGYGSAVDAYLADPATRVVAIEQDGEVTGAFVSTSLTPGVSQCHCLLTQKCHPKIEAARLGQLWAFGPGGVSRLVGRASSANRPAIHFASKTGMSRIYEHDGEVYTALGIEDWPWHHARWCLQAAPGLSGPEGVMLGAFIRLVRAGGAVRGAALFNEWAPLHGAPGIDLVKHTPDSALCRYRGALYFVLPDRIEPAEVNDEHR